MQNISIEMTEQAIQCAKASGAQKILTPGQLEKKSLIERLDLEPVKFKLMKDHGWSLSQADDTERLYKGYLLLYIVLPGVMHVPTKAIDEMWHVHILDTKKYMKDCLHVFGAYLHHYPYLGQEEENNAQDQFLQTQKNYREVLGFDILGRQYLTDCGGGCAGGCSSSSCSSPTPDPDPSPGPVPAACGGTAPDDQKKKRKDRNVPDDAVKTPGPWSWIPSFDLQRFCESLGVLGEDNDYRPDREAVEALSEVISSKKQIH